MASSPPSSSSSPPPVVWCSDPTSANSKPTAFALHGIQLHGNLTERQVLALRELVAAAAEGRLLIPADGATVQLDCGISIGSAIVQEQQQQQQHKETYPARRPNTQLTITQPPERNKRPNLPLSTATDPEDCDYRLYTNSVYPYAKASTLMEQQQHHQQPHQPQNNNCITIERLFSSNTFTSEKSDTKSPTPLDNTYITANTTSADELYEFLCCAKCMNNRSVCHQQPNNQQSSARATASVAASNATKTRHHQAIEHVTYVTNRYLRKFAAVRSAQTHARKLQLCKSLKRGPPKSTVLRGGNAHSALYRQRPNAVNTACGGGLTQPNSLADAALYATVQRTNHCVIGNSNDGVNVLQTQRRQHNNDGVDKRAPIVKDLHSPSSVDNNDNHMANRCRCTAEQQQQPQRRRRCGAVGCLSKNKETTTQAYTVAVIPMRAQHMIGSTSHSNSSRVSATNNNDNNNIASDGHHRHQRGSQCQATATTTLTTPDDCKRTHLSFGDCKHSRINGCCGDGDDVEKKSITAKINDIGVALSMVRAANDVNANVNAAVVDSSSVDVVVIGEGCSMEATLPIDELPSTTPSSPSSGHSQHHQYRHAIEPATECAKRTQMTPPTFTSSSRKTSFDSSCTEHGSTDSGFIEMQNRLETNLMTIANNEQSSSSLSSASSSSSSSSVEPRENAGKEVTLSRANKCDVFALPIMMPVCASDESNDKHASDKNSSSSNCSNDGVDAKQNKHDDHLLWLPLLPNVKSCLVQQSKNRRKSYEEFKATFVRQHPKQLDNTSAATNTTNMLGATPNANDTASMPFSDANAASSGSIIKSRRKSYEEFKRLVRECDAVEQPKHLQRKNSKRSSLKQTAAQTRRASLSSALLPFGVNDVVAEERATDVALITTGLQQTGKAGLTMRSGAIYDILQRRASAPVGPTLGSTTTMTTTLYEKLRPFGTLYDIVQKKTHDLGHKYDQYMTYGTLYEILQRKSSTSSSAYSTTDAAGEGFQRKRALSEKFIKRSAVTADPKYNTMHFGTIYDIVQRKHQQQSASRLFQLPILVEAATKKTRFSVKKVPEEEVLQINNPSNCTEMPVPNAMPAASASGTLDEYSEAEAILTKVKKPTRLRRFSNILSYNPKSTAESITPIREDVDASVHDMRENQLLSEQHNANGPQQSRTGDTAVPAVTQRPHIRKNGIQQCNQPADFLRRLQLIEACEREENTAAALVVVDNGANKHNNTNCQQQRGLSIWTRKALWRKDKSRRLSEFTRGEFLNEKA